MKLDVLERLLIGSGIVAFALFALFALTGWHIEGIALGNVGLLPESQVQRGERLYGVYCSTCHGGPEIAPPGQQVSYPPRHNASGHTWQHPDCQIVTIVTDGGDDMTRAMRAAQAPPGAAEMPAFKDRLSRNDIVAVLAYIKTMWTPEERSVQENLTRGACQQ